MLVERLIASIVARTGICRKELVFWSNGERLDPYKTILESDFEDGDTVDVHKEQRGGKPVIYLYPPSGTEIDVQVRLSLIPQWSFSAMYPPAAIEHANVSGHLTGQETSWDVHARSDGLLTDKKAGVDVTYLFWEAT